MTELKWERPELHPDDPGAGASTKQLFEGKNSVRADIFVREDLQNRVDARRKDHAGPVRCSIRKLALPRKLIDKYFPPAFQNEFVQTETQHLDRKKAERRAKKIRDLFASSSLSVIVIEDFGTTGLNGPINSKIPVKDKNSPLYHETNALTCFLRRNGRSGKTDKSLGAAGLGRHVYYMASEISTKLIYTVPTDLWTEQDGKLTMLDAAPMFFGQSFQNEREERVGNQQKCFNGYVHLTSPTRIGELPTPFGLTEGSRQLADEARKDFKLERQADQPGCSIIIPFPRSTMDVSRLRDTIAAEFALPILSGELEVTVQGDTIDAETLIGLSSDGNVNEANRFLRDTLVAEPQLTLDIGPERLDRPIQASDFDRKTLKRLAGEFHDERLVCVSARIQFNQSPESTGLLTVATRKTPRGTSGRGLVARKGLVLSKLSDRRYSQPQNSCMLMKAGPDRDADALAALLRSVETPSHEDWIAADIAEDDCEDPKALLERVKTVHKDLVSILTNLDTEEDASIFSDLLPSGGVTEVVDPPPGETSPFSIRLLDDGQTLSITTSASYDAEPGVTWDVLAVLDSIQGAGRARKSFQPGSFNLQQASITTTGGEAFASSPCLLTMTVNEPDRFEMQAGSCEFPDWADIRVHASRREQTGDRT